MKIASRTQPPRILPETPHAIWKFPICPTLVDSIVPAGQDYEGASNFGDGTKYPIARKWFTNADAYSRPGALLLRRESYYKAVKRSSGAVSEFKFGPVIGPPRCQQQFELACGKSAVVSQTLQQPPPPAGLVDYRIIMGYAFLPEIAIDSSYRGQDMPPWADGVQSYLHQIAAVSAYFIEDVLTRGLFSEIPRNNSDTNPLSRYEKCGTAKIDLRDQTKENGGGDGESLLFEFPLYRDKWQEDGFPGPPPGAPAAWYSQDALVSIAYVGWDRTPDDFTEVTEDMTAELEPQ